MYCPKCGMTVSEGALYCPGCDYYMGGADTSSSPVRKIGFGEAISNFFTQYVTFSGRATRSEFWYAVLFHIIVYIALFVLKVIEPGAAVILEGLYGMAIFIPSLAIIWRRLHDVDRSGAWYFIGLIPTIGTIILLVFLAGDSRPDNRFGPRKV